MVLGIGEIKAALTQVEDQVKAQASTLKELESILKEKIDGPTLESRLQKFGDALTKKVDAIQADSETKFHELQEADNKIMHRESLLESQLKEAAEEVKLLHQEEDELESREAELEKRVEELASVVKAKADANRVEEDEKLLGSTKEKLNALELAQSEMQKALEKKAWAAELENQIDRLTQEEQTLARLDSQVEKALPLKVDLKQFEEDLSSLSEKMQKEIARLNGNVKMEHDDIRQALARRVDVDDFQRHVGCARDTHEQLTALERQHLTKHDRVSDVLASKADNSELQQMRQEHTELISLCARKEYVLWEFKKHQELIDKNTALEAKHNEHHIAALARKLEKETFERRWQEGIAGKVETELTEQKQQLKLALDKKDELIALAEGMQSDLTCALALRGRGPPRLGPLVRPNSRKIRKDASDAHMASLVPS